MLFYVYSLYELCINTHILIYLNNVIVFVQSLGILLIDRFQRLIIISRKMTMFDHLMKAVLSSGSVL